jgi:hypothetical protein
MTNAGKNYHVQHDGFSFNMVKHAISDKLVRHIATLFSSHDSLETYTVYRPRLVRQLSYL